MAIPENPINRYESYLAKIAGQEVEVPDHPITREEAYLDEIARNGAGGGGTKDYEELTHKPSIGGVELSGDKSLSDLGAASEEAVAAKASQTDIAPAFSDAAAYTAGNVVYYEGSLYRFTADHVAGAWDIAEVESVTVDDLVDGLKPVDSVTNGDMNPVTSNAVYDYTREAVEVTADGTETWSELLARLKALIDMSKVGSRTRLSVQSTGAVYTPSAISDLNFVFTKSVIGSSIADSYIETWKVIAKSTSASSFYGYIKESFNSSGVVTASFIDNSSTVARGKVALLYR